jgi:mono/diheme cytochrome c family protein
MRCGPLCVALLAAAAGAAAAQDAAEGERLFQRHCATCHGIEATGNGPMAPVLTIQPTDLTRLAATAGDGAFPLLRVARRIDGSDPLVAHGSPMPVFGAFFDTADHVALRLPDGQPLLLPRAVADLIAHLESIQRRD